MKKYKAVIRIWCKNGTELEFVRFDEPLSIDELTKWFQAYVMICGSLEFHVAEIDLDENEK
jgi:hypothetical protein